MPDGAPEHPAENSMTPESSPEAAAAQSEIRRLLETAIDALPQAQRTVFMLRAVEEFSTEDTATCLGIPPETVKTRLHRAKQAQNGRAACRESVGQYVEIAGVAVSIKKKKK